MGKILPSEIQRWVTTATENGLSAASVRKYHTMLALGLRTRPARPGRSPSTPAPTPSSPRVVKKKARTLTPAEYDAILAALPAQHRLMVETAINTGLRWGELIALKPRHLDLTKPHADASRRPSSRSPIKNSPTGARMLTKPYPKDNEPRTMELPPDLVDQLADWITADSLGPGRPAVRDPRGHPDLAEHLPHPRLAARRRGVRASTSTSASTTSATPTPPGSSPAAPTSSPSWTAWATPRSPPPRNTSTPSPTPTPRTSTPSTASGNPEQPGEAKPGAGEPGAGSDPRAEQLASPPPQARRGRRTDTLGRGTITIPWPSRSGNRGAAQPRSARGSTYPKQPSETHTGPLTCGWILTRSGPKTGPYRDIPEARLKSRSSPRYLT